MKIIRIIQSLLLGIFGAMSLFMTLSVVFDWFGIREKEGNYVLFIVLTNMAAGSVYLFTAYINWKKPKLGMYMLAFTTVALSVAFLFLMNHINNGGSFESKTLIAMLFRIVFTAIMAIVSLYLFKKSNQKNQF